MSKSGKKSRLGVFGKLAIFIGRAKTSPKLEGLLQEILAKLANLKSQCEVRHAQEQDNAAHLLQNFDYELAALGARRILREQNMLNVLKIVESYCKLLLDRSETLKNASVCPDDLMEPISSVIFCSPRLADLPELQQLTFIFQEKFGGETMSILGDHKVNKQILKNLSENKPTFQSVFHLLKDICAEKKIPTSPDAFQRTLQGKHQGIDAPQDQEEEELEEENLETGRSPDAVCNISNGSSSSSESATSLWSQETAPNKETFGNKNEERKLKHGMEGSMKSGSAEQRSPLQKLKSISVFNPTQEKVQSPGNYLWSSKTAIMRVAGSSKGMRNEDWYIQSNSRLLSLKRRRAQSLHILPDAFMEEERKPEG